LIILLIILKFDHTFNHFIYDRDVNESWVLTERRVFLSNDNLKKEFYITPQRYFKTSIPIESILEKRKIRLVCKIK